MPAMPIWIGGFPVPVVYSFVLPWIVGDLLPIIPGSIFALGIEGACVVCPSTFSFRSSHSDFYFFVLPRYIRYIMMIQNTSKYYDE